MASASSRRRDRLLPVVIIDSSPVFRLGLASMLASGRFRVVASGSGLGDLPKRALKDGRAALLEVDADDNSTVRRISDLTRQGVQVIVMSEQFRAETVLAVIEAGAAGYFLKREIDQEVLLRGLEAARLHLVTIGPGLPMPLKEQTGRPDNIPATTRSRTIFESRSSSIPRDATPTSIDTEDFSRKERLILELLTQGASNAHIAGELGIAEPEAKVQIYSLFRKIGVKNRTQAALWASGCARALAE